MTTCLYFLKAGSLADHDVCCIGETPTDTGEFSRSFAACPFRNCMQNCPDYRPMEDSQ